MTKEINYQVGDEKRVLTPSGTELQAKGIKQLMERIEDENSAKSTTEVELDGSNKVGFPGFPYFFEALGEKLIVSIDVFKSGFECRDCKGKKRIQYTCVCEAQGHPGLKYSKDDLDALKVALGDDIALARANMKCTDCDGVYEEQRGEEMCSTCKGVGAVLVLPDDSKKLPTTGVVVSKGDKCTNKNIPIGCRILFGPYAGSMIPTKAGLMFKVIDESQAWCRIEGGEDMAAFDFIIPEEKQG